MNEQKAVARLKRGDAGGLEALVRKYQVQAVRRVARGRLPLRSPLAATLLLLGLAALITPSLLGPNGLPQSGAAMPWRGGPEYRVPAGSWTSLLPVARVLAGAAPWLTLLVVALQVWQQVSGGRRPPGRFPARTRRRLSTLALGYSGLLVAALSLRMLAALQRGVPPATVWNSRRVLVLWGLVSLTSVLILTAGLCRRSGAGRWSGWLYALALAVQIPAWLLGLWRLYPVWGLFELLALLQGIPVPPVWEWVVPWLSTPALAALVWYLVVAARTLRQADGRET